MSDKKEALQNGKLFINAGAYAAAANYFESLPAEMKNEPEIVIEHYRASLLQGHALRAEESLLQADPTAWPSGWCLIYTLERASVRVYRYVALRESMEDARVALAQYKDELSGTPEWFEAQRIYIRILLTAATYRIINSEAEKEALAGLPRIASVLKNAGRTDEGLAASFTYAERQPELETRLTALEAVAQDAVALGRPGKEAEARVLKAEQMLKANFPDEEILPELNTAKSLYEAMNHAHGATDVDRVKAMTAVRRSLANTDELVSCLDAYRRNSFYRGQFMVLMDLSQLAHGSGRTSEAIAYREQLFNLTEETGMGLTKDSITTAAVDLLMRNADYGGAIALCRAAIEAGAPNMTRAGYELLLASAYSFVNDYEDACTHGRHSVELYEAAGAEDAASDAALKLGSDLSSFSKEDSWAEAESLLNDWVVQDKERKDLIAAVAKLEMLAQIKIQRFNAAKEPKPASLLDEADKIIADGEALADSIQGREAVQRLGNLYQLRGQVFTAKGDEEGFVNSWQRALEVFEKGGLLFEAANCRYILGCAFLNRANRDLPPNFGEAERNFNGALDYYEPALMRERSADTRFFLARLYVNAAVQVQNLRTQLLDAALGHLANAEGDYDAIRREFNPGNEVLETQQGKQALTNKSRKIYDLALQITCSFIADASAAWDWAQRAKARGLTDLLGLSEAPPKRIIKAIEQYPGSLRLVCEEQRLTKAINHASYNERPALQRDLQTLTAKMKTDANLVEYLALREGAAVGPDELEEILSEEITTGKPVVCIDWVSAGDSLFLLLARSGHGAQLQPLPVRLSEVTTFMNRFLSKENFRSNLKTLPDLFRQLDALIRPLATLTQPEELLVLSPSGPLSALPLHILEIENTPLLVRNPVVYCSSLSVLRHCLARRYRPEKFTAAVFGDPNANLDKAAALVTHLAALFQTQPLLKEAVTRAAFTTSLEGNDIVHFQGHAEHNPMNPLRSCLHFSDGELAVQDIFDLNGLQASLTTLAACESAVNTIAAGDEPLGLIPAFLYAGANTVLATLWKVNQDAAAQIMEGFYTALLPNEGVVNKAQALRSAMLALREKPGFDSPYYWASFVLYGDWH